MEVKRRSKSRASSHASLPRPQQAAHTHRDLLPGWRPALGLLLSVSHGKSICPGEKIRKHQHFLLELSLELHSMQSDHVGLSLADPASPLCIQITWILLKCSVWLRGLGCGLRGRISYKLPGDAVTDEDKRAAWESWHREPVLRSRIFKWWYWRELGDHFRKCLILPCLKCV